MKKYPVSSFSVVLFFALLFFLLALSVFSVLELIDFVSSYRNGNVLLHCLITPAITVLGLADLLYIAVKDMPFASLSVSQAGITEKMGFRELFHNWEDFSDCGILKNHSKLSEGSFAANTYWVFFSTDVLSDQEKRLFLRKTRKDLNRIAFFQYQKEMLDEILPFVPQRFADTLKKQSAMIEQKAN